MLSGKYTSPQTEWEAPHSECAAVAMKNSRHLGMKQTCPGLHMSVSLSDVEIGFL